MYMALFTTNSNNHNNQNFSSTIDYLSFLRTSSIAMYEKSHALLSHARAHSRVLRAGMQASSTLRQT